MWNYNNLFRTGEEEHDYMIFSSYMACRAYNIYNKLDKININVYSDIKNNREKIRQDNKLKKIEKLFNEIDRI